MTELPSERERHLSAINMMIAIIIRLKNEGKIREASWMRKAAIFMESVDYQEALPHYATVHNMILAWAETLQGDGQAQDSFESMLSGLFGIIGGNKHADNTELVNFLCQYDDFLCACLGFDLDQAHVFGESAEVTRTRLAMAVEKKALAARLQKQVGGKKIG